MANFTPSKKTAQDFNGGVEYQDQDLANNVQGDTVHAATVNNLVESQLYSQELAENIQGLANNTPDTTYIADEGAASVEIERLSDGTPRFKFSHLKGQKGDKGDSGVGVATSSMIWLYTADNGDLYVRYLDGTTPPQFRLDNDKNLYYII